VLGELDDLARRVEEIGERALVLRDRLAALPAEREAAEREHDEAEERLRDVETALAEARAAAEERPDDAEAQRALVRAEDAAHGTWRVAQQARERAERLAQEAEARVREAEELATTARELAAELGERPGIAEAASHPPGASLDEVAAWATEARAALLVARSNLAAQRDAVIRQANELGSLVLGEPLAAQTPASVVRRLESRER
jgi:chromosome segregation ATPase